MDNRVPHCTACSSRPLPTSASTPRISTQHPAPNPRRACNQLLRLAVLTAAGAGAGASSAGDIEAGRLRRREVWRVEDLLHKLLKRLLDAGLGLGAAFYEEHPAAPCKVNPLRPRHLSVGLVDLVADEQLDHAVAVRVHVNLLQPLLEVLKCLFPRHIVHQNHALGSSIVGARQSPEPLLTCRIPYCELDLLIFHFDWLDLEIHPDGRRLVGREGIVCESQKNA
mmetsp:Transcript_34965/g.69875  ORF Transcript_34965/g.69875 Transcript_34965/m.69875 type:complete len:224 (-) Transcript_34965:130-801(-)